MWSNNLQAYLQNTELSVKNLVKGIRMKLKTNDDANWKAKVWIDTGQENGNKLRTYRLYKSNLIAEDYVKINMKQSHRRSIAKFRSGSLKKTKNKKTTTNVPLNNRICNLCTDNVIEDEVHFILCCDFCSDVRRPLLPKVQ